MFDSSEKRSISGLAEAFIRDTPSSHNSRYELAGIKTQTKLTNSAALAGVAAIDRQTSLISTNVMSVLAGIARSGADSERRLGEIHAALTDGTEMIQNVGRDIQGIASPGQDLEELRSSGKVKDEELLILMATGVLAHDQRVKLQNCLPSWKMELLTGGLVSAPDSKREKDLSEEEKLFLFKLRQSSRSFVGSMASLVPLARNQLLDPAMHSELAETINEIRFGTEGGAAATKELVLHAREASQLRNMGILQRERMIGVASEQLGVSQRHLEVGERHLDVEQRHLEVGERHLDVGQRHLQVGEASLAVQAEGVNVARSIDLRIADVVLNTGYMRADLTRIAHSNDRLAEIGEMGLGKLTSIDNRVANVVGELMESNQWLERNSDQNERHIAVSEDIRDVSIAIRDINVAQLEVLVGLYDGVGALYAQGEDIASGLSRLEVLNRSQLGMLVGVDGRLGALTSVLEVGIQRIVGAISQNTQVALEIAVAHERRDLNMNRIRSDERIREATLLYEGGEIDKAIKALDAAEGKWAADFRIYFERARCYISKGMANEAIVDFKSALRFIDDGEPRLTSLVMLNLARLYYSLYKITSATGDIDEGREWLMQAMAISSEAIGVDPEFGETYFSFAVYLASYGLYEDALKILMKILAQDQKYLEKMNDFAVLDPLRNGLKNIIEDRDGNFSIALLRDALEAGNVQFANEIFAKSFLFVPFDLVRGKVWEFDELDEAVVKRVLDTPFENIDQCYGALSLAVNCDGISQGKIYRLFLVVADKYNLSSDKEDFLIVEKLKQWLGEGYARFVDILNRKINPKYPWLNACL